MSDDGLPDWRVEKSAITSSKLGHEVIFGGKSSPAYKGNTFSKIYEINWTAKARMGLPFHWRPVKKKIDQLIREVKPDMVHAHNIFSAKMALELNVPFVYDDHEFWSKQSVMLNEIAGKLSIGRASLKSGVFKVSELVARKIINKNIERLWTKWEKEIVSSHPTIAVSDQIANELKLIGGSTKVFVVENFPMSTEVKGFENPVYQNELSSVYAGVDGNYKGKQANRDIDGFTDLFANNKIGRLTIIGWKAETSSTSINYAGLLSRHEMFQEMFKHSIGLIPWKKHWSHSFVNPNKAYEYAHAGLFVMCTSSFKTLIATLGNNCCAFEDYDDLISKLKYLKGNMEEVFNKRLKIFEFAKSELIWEKHEKNIINAYQNC